MPSPITVTSYTLSGSGVRYNPPPDSLPRWMGAWTNQNSPLRGIHWGGIGYWTTDLHQKTSDYYRASWWGAECSPYRMYVSAYTWTKPYIPQVVMVGVGREQPAALVYEVQDPGSFLYELRYPVMYVSETGALHFRNLANVQTTIQALSGYVDLGTTLTSDPRLPDTPIILTNQWGDDEVVDHTDYRWTTGNRLYVGENLVYTCTWTSSALHYAWVAGTTTYLTVDGNRITLTDSYIPGAWDVRAEVLGIVRRERETNISLKHKVQAQACCSRPEVLISNALGQSVSWYWNPQNTLNLNASGITKVEIPEFEDYEYRTEYLVKDGTEFRFLATPQSSGLTHVYLNQVLVDSTQYTITGNTLIPGNSKLRNAGQGQVYAQYKVAHFTIPTSGAYVTSLVTNLCVPNTYYVWGARKVSMRNIKPRIKTWNWNREVRGVQGLANFEQ